MDDNDRSHEDNIESVNGDSDGTDRAGTDGAGTDGDRTQAFPAGALDTDNDDSAEDLAASWRRIGAARGPRAPAEGVRIIGADEAASAIETGKASPRMPETALKFGDVPAAPAGPRPTIRFPGSDPATLTKPPVAEPPPPLRNLWDSPANQAPPSPPPSPPVGAGPAVGRSRVPRPIDSRPAESSSFATSTPEGEVMAARSARFEELVSRDRSGLAAKPPATNLSTDGPPAPPPVSRPPSWDLFEDPPLTGSPTYAGSSDRGGDDLFDSSPAGAGAFGSSDLDSDDFGRDPGSGDFESGDFGSGDFAGTDFAGSGGSDSDEASGAVVLPHWTEPPSGEVPRLLADSVFSEDPGADNTSAWSSLSTGPRWRDQPTDWDDSDFHEDFAEDGSARVGALRESPGIDDDQFDRASEPGARPASRAMAGGGSTRTRTRPAGTRDGGPPAGQSGQPASRMRAGGPGQGHEMNGGGPSSSGSDIGTRVVTGLVAGGVALACAAIGPKALVLLVAIVLVLAAAEFHQALRSGGHHPATLLGLAATAAIVGATYWRGGAAQPVILTLVLVFSLFWYLFGVIRARPTVNVAVTVMAFVYIGFLGSYASLILQYRHGVGLLLGAVIATVAHDVGSYFAGRMAGHTPLAPAISPNKTFEGLVGGTFATLVVCLIAVRAMDPPWNMGRAFALAVVVSVLSPLGDLCESLIKRDLGVKDMGKVLPGHGGILDRIDALLFVIPAAYYLAVVMKFG